MNLDWIRTMSKDSPPQITVDQHQVFQGYYRRYAATGKDNDLIFLNKKGERLKRHQSAASLTTEEFLYEVEGMKPNEIENWFSKLEGIWGKAMGRANKRDPLTIDEVRRLTQFAFYTAARTKEAIERMAKVYEIERQTDSATGRNAYLRELSTLTDAAIRDWETNLCSYAIITPRVEEPFYLSSDRPIIFGDLKGRPMLSERALYYSIGSIVFPLSSERLFVAYIGDFPHEIVEKHNQIQIWLSKEVLVANKPQLARAQFELSSFARPWVSAKIIQASYRFVPDSDGEKLARTALIGSSTSEHYISPKGTVVHLWPDESESTAQCCYELALSLNQGVSQARHSYGLKGSSRIFFKVVRYRANKEADPLD